jgi:hypothetical protein
MNAEHFKIAICLALGAALFAQHGKETTPLRKKPPGPNGAPRKPRAWPRGHRRK